MRRQQVIKLNKTAYAEIVKKLDPNYFIETPIGRLLDMTDVVVADKSYMGGKYIWSVDPE